jgi:hypothetical protein
MRRFILCFLFLCASFFSFGQNSSAKDLTIYDPSFWKKELKLDHFQYRRMCEINHEFYERLIAAFRTMKNDRGAFRLAFAQCWINRNTQLLETMNGRQRKKWKKIMAEEPTLVSAQADLKSKDTFFYIGE